MASTPPVTAEALRALAQTPPKDGKARKQLYEAAKELMWAVESPGDADHRLYYGAAQTGVLQTASQLDIFATLAASPSPQTITALSKATSCDPILLHRLCRWLTSIGTMTETGPATYSANALTAHASTPGFKSGIDHFANLVDKPFLAIPAWLRQNGNINATDPFNIPFQLGLNTDLDIMGYLHANPEKAPPTFGYMAYNRMHSPTWMDGSVPVIKDFTLSPSDVEKGRVMLVDVGGGSGHQCLFVRQAFPQLQGKMVVQDVGMMISLIDASTAQASNLEPMAHDFYTPQPIRGAKVYYLRNVLHDWSDEKCKVILRHLRDAMVADSVVVIDEIVVPEVRASYRVVTFDLTMMVAAAAKERSRGEWEALLKECGLAVRDVWVYDDDLQSAVTVAVPV